MLRRLGALALVAIALVASGCGTRADFSARPSTQATQVIDEIINSPGVTGAAGGAASSQTQTLTRSVLSRLRAGSGIRGGVIKIGGLFPLSGGLSALGIPPAKAAQAYFRYLNDHGGINGLKIDFEICDDKADPNLSATCTNRLLSSGAFVMGPSFTPFSQNVVPILERKGVPWVGYDGINVEGFASNLVVTAGAPIQTMAHALVPYWYRQVERNTGIAPKKIGAVYLDVAPARTYVTEAQKVICPKLGCTLDPVQRVTYFDLNYSQICLNMQSANVDAVWIITDPASAVKMLVQCREVKYKPRAGFLGQHGIYLDLTVQQSGSWADGTVANSALLPPSVDAPAVREMKQIVGTYESDVDYGYFTELAYVSARMTEDVIREALRVDPSLTRASMLVGASHLTDYRCHGLCLAVNLAPPAGSHGGNHNVWMVRAKFDRGAASQWVLDGGPIDAWRSETWPRPGRP